MLSFLFALGEGKDRLGNLKNVLRCFFSSSPVFPLPPFPALVLFLRERELSRYLYDGPTFGGERSGSLFVVLFYFTTSHQPPQTPLFTFPDFPLPYPLFFLFTPLTLPHGTPPLLSRKPFFAYIGIRGHGETMERILCMGAGEDGRKGEKRDGGSAEIP